MVSERFELEIVLSRLPCRHPNNHFAVLGRLNQKRQNRRVSSRCAEPLFVIPACETKIRAKIAAFRVSDWLRSAPAWGLWMGPLLSRCSFHSTPLQRSHVRRPFRQIAGRLPPGEDPALLPSQFGVVRAVALLFSVP